MWPDFDTVSPAVVQTGQCFEVPGFGGLGFRPARIMRFFPELMALVKGMISAAKAR